ncbi:MULTISPECIES: hypothetical protein [Rickettsieae]|nr:hypothetical protein [Rickettsia endosymbiont of Culicoides newsteadi]
MTSGCFFYYFYAMRIVNSREFGARNDGATPISNRRTASDDVPSHQLTIY